MPAHEAAITSLAMIPQSTDDSDASSLVATASHDLTARLIRMSLSPSTSPSTLHAVASLHLHTAPLTSICPNTSGSNLLTASVDGLIGLWDTALPEQDEVPFEESQGGKDRKKRRRVAEDQANRPIRKSPIAVLKSHTARVSRAVYLPEDRTKAVSAGFDSTVRTWDTENGVCIGNIVSISPSGLIVC